MNNEGYQLMQRLDSLFGPSWGEMIADLIAKAVVTFIVMIALGFMARTTWWIVTSV